MELASCHRSDALNFEASAGLLENLSKPFFFLHMVIIYMLLFSYASWFSFKIFKFVLLFCSLCLLMIM